MSTPRLHFIAPLVAASCLTALSADRAAAQVAQVVQLPEFHYFTVNTTVLVPDRGATYLGGVNYSSAGHVQRGIPGLGGRPFANTTIGRSTVGGGVSISAYIHDFDAMEAQLLGQSGANGHQAQQRPMPRAIAATKGEPSFGASVAALRAEAANEEQAQQKEAEAYLQRARQVLSDGKPGLAKIYFQMAARRATGPLREQALSGLKTIEGDKTRSLAAER